MRVSDRERRRLDAEAFDLLEREDGFRLQLLVEFRNRASRSRRLLIDELANANLIKKERHHEIAEWLGVDPNTADSLVGEQTLGEESYEDSIVDVAPVPRSIENPISASIKSRATLAQGSRLALQQAHFLSEEAGDHSKSDVNDDSSEMDMSSLTMHPQLSQPNPASALIGAPARQRSTTPDGKNFKNNLGTEHVRDQTSILLPLIDQIEGLLELNRNDADNALIRSKLAAHYFSRLCFEIEMHALKPEFSARLQQLCVSLLASVPNQNCVDWVQSFLSAALNLLQVHPTSVDDDKTTGYLQFRMSPSASGVRIDRLSIENGLIKRETLTLEPNRTEEVGENGERFTSHFVLPEGWYETSWFDGETTQCAQSFISETSGTLLPPQGVKPDTEGFQIVPGGMALLGKRSENQTHLPFNLYEVGSFYLASAPVTHREYFMFLRFIAQTQGKQAAIRRSPRSAARGDFRWANLDFTDLNACAEHLDRTFDTPITGISFHDARAYCHWLNIEHGPGHRLPSEVEWAKAILGCLGSRWAWGDVWSPNLSQLPSPFGIRIPAGIRLEWTSSSGSDTRYRILRGQGLQYESAQHGLSERLFLPEEQVDKFVGFRVARSG